jgi:hypothetical protein
VLVDAALAEFPPITEIDGKSSNEIGEGSPAVSQEVARPLVFRTSDRLVQGSQVQKLVRP